MRAVSVALVVSALGCAHAAVDAPLEAPAARAPSKRPFPVVAGVAIVGGAAAAVPKVRSAVRKLLNRDDPLAGLRPEDFMSEADAEPVEISSAGPPKSRDPRALNPEAGNEAASMGVEVGDGDQFQLTPDRLSTISELNVELEKIVAQLASVPVFTAAVGNGTSPLTVPSEDGKKLAYFFTEHADAEAFLRAVRENTGVELAAQVIGVSLADIIAAYGSDEAKQAKETFVIIPTMGEVAAARHIMKRAGKAEAMEVLGAGSGLVPLFWCEQLAVQSAGGQQRKVLFFKLGDLQAMWKSLADARKEQGEIDELPEGPTVQVSDLQTMAGLLVSANKTDEVMFLPSSTALRFAQGQSGRAGTRGGGPPGMSLGGEEAAAAAGGEDMPEGGADVGVDDFQGEEEEVEL